MRQTSKTPTEPIRDAVEAPAEARAEAGAEAVFRAGAVGVDNLHSNTRLQAEGEEAQVEDREKKIK